MPQCQNIQFRKATSLDIEAVLEIDSHSSVGWKRQMFEKELETSFSNFIIAILDTSIVGFIIAWIVSDEIQIHNLAVHKKYRRQGIGSALINFLITNIVQAGQAKLILEVRQQNTKARAFYKALGFYITGQRKNYYQNDHAVLMEKNL